MGKGEEKGIKEHKSCQWVSLVWSQLFLVYVRESPLASPALPDTEYGSEKGRCPGFVLVHSIIKIDKMKNGEIINETTKTWPK